MKGVKFDYCKPKAGVLLDFSRALERIVDIGTYGADLYGRKNWEQLDDARTRYLDAAMRHLLAYPREKNDKDTGQSHLAHVVWNLLAIIELEERDNEQLPEMVSNWACDRNSDDVDRTSIENGL